MQELIMRDELSIKRPHKKKMIPTHALFGRLLELLLGRSLRVRANDYDDCVALDTNLTSFEFNQL